MIKKAPSTLLIVLAVTLLAACAAPTTPSPTPAPIPNPYPAQPGDDSLQRGDVQIVSATLQGTGTPASPLSLVLEFRLPTPCYRLRLNLSAPDTQNRILLDLYALAPRDQACTLMALATPQQADLALGSFPAGHYTVWLNGQQVGVFTV